MAHCGWLIKLITVFYLLILLSQEELGKWIIPQDYDHIEAEAAHLLYEADTNKVCNNLVSIP